MASAARSLQREVPSLEGLLFILFLSSFFQKEVCLTQVGCGLSVVVPSKLSERASMTGRQLAMDEMMV